MRHTARATRCRAGSDFAAAAMTAQETTWRQGGLEFQDSGNLIEKGRDYSRMEKSLARQHNGGAYKPALQNKYVRALAQLRGHRGEGALPCPRRKLGRIRLACGCPVMHTRWLWLALLPGPPAWSHLPRSGNRTCPCPCPCNRVGRRLPRSGNRVYPCPCPCPHIKEEGFRFLYMYIHAACVCVADISRGRLSPFSCAQPLVAHPRHHGGGRKVRVGGPACG